MRLNPNYSKEVVKELIEQERFHNLIQKYKDEFCSECCGRHTCVDLSGDLIDEQIKICMEKNR